MAKKNSSKSDLPQAVPHPAAKSDTMPSPITPEEACRRAMDAIVCACPEIVEAQIAKAREGSYLHARLLFDFAGLSGALGAPDSAADDSLARVLLRELQIEDETSEDAAGEQTPLG